MTKLVIFCLVYLGWCCYILCRWHGGVPWGWTSFPWICSLDSVVVSQERYLAGCRSFFLGLSQTLLVQWCCHQWLGWSWVCSLLVSVLRCRGLRGGRCCCRLGLRLLFWVLWHCHWCRWQQNFLCCLHSFWWVWKRPLAELLIVNPYSAWPSWWVGSPAYWGRWGASGWV